MVALSAPDIAKWESQYDAFYLAYVHAPVVVFAALVNMASVTYPVNQLTFDTVTTGAYTDIQEETLLLLGSSAGASDYGRVRVHADSSGVVATATTVNIGRASQGDSDGELIVTDNCYLTVLDLRPIWAAPPFIDSATDPDNPVTYKDGVWTFNATYAFKPVALAGVDSLKIVANSGASATFDFDGSGSYPTHPSATSTITYAWVFPGGTPSTSTSASPTGVSFPVGARYVKLTVTDSLGNTQSTWRLKAVSYPGDPNLISKFAIARHRQALDGQEFQIRVDSPLSYLTYPSGTEILLAAREDYGGTVGSLSGYADAKDMVLAGWLHDEHNTGEATKKGFIGRTTLSIHDAAGRLKLLPGFPQVVERESTPANWVQMAGANIDRYLYYLLRWHSNTLSRVDFLWSATLDTYGFATLGSDGSSLYDQTDKRCQAIAYRLACNKNGQLVMKPDPLLQPTAAQTSTYSLPAARTTVVKLPITEHDWMNYDYTYTRPPRVHWNRGEAIQVSTADLHTLTDIATLFEVSPGLAPGQGLTSQVSGQQLAISQDELDVREGNRYRARMNAREGYFTVQIRPGDAIDPAEMVWVQFTISAATAGPRGRTYSSERFLPVELNHSYDHKKGLRTTKISLEREVSGTPGVIDPQFPALKNPVIVPPLPPPSLLEPPPYVPRPPWDGHDIVPTKIIVFDTAAASCHVGMAWNPTTYTISWTNRSTGLSGNPLWACADPWNYKRYFCATTAGLYRNDDPFGGSSWALVATWTTIFGGSSNYGYHVFMSINRQGYIGIKSGGHIGYSFDYGATWHDVTIVSGYGATVDSIALSPYNNPGTAGQGWLYFAHLYGNALADIYKSTDWGATWSVIASGATYVGQLNIPYIRVDGTTPNINDGSQQIISNNRADTHPNNNSSYSANAGVSWSVYWSLPSSGNFAKPLSQGYGYSFMSFTYDGSILAFGCTNNFNALDRAVRTLKSPLGTDDSTGIGIGDNIGASSYCNRFSVHKGAILNWSRSNDKLWWSLDNGQTWANGTTGAALPGGYTACAYAEWPLYVIVPPPG